jgi:hypothetical protein
MPLTQTLPDVETILVAYLKTVVDLTNLISTRTSTSLPASPTFPSLRLQRIGGIPSRLGHDAAHIQFDCYGKTDVEAFEVARRAFKAVMEMPYLAPVLSGVSITAVDPSTPISWLPDTSRQNEQGKAQPRYVMGVIVTSHTI